MSQWQPPLLAPPPRQVRWGRRAVLAVAIVLASCILLCGLLGIYGRYKTTHDIPNPFWGVFNESFSYTPEQGPPGGGLLVSRPDVIVRQYLTDYIRVAHTYPCVQDLNQYESDQDPFLLGKPCTVTRPVASFAVTSVRVYVAGESLGRFPSADVNYVVTYADGRSWASSIVGMIPHRHDSYVFAYAHQDCWDSDGLLLLYPAIVPQVPPGAEYPVREPNGNITSFQCQPAETTG